MKPYPIEFRERIFNYANNHGIRETARVFNIAINTVRFLQKLFYETGSLMPRPRHYTYSHLITPDGELYIQCLLAKQPDLSLRELCELYEEEYQVKISLSTMSNTLKKMGFTRKKKSFYDPKKTVRKSSNRPNYI